MEQPMKTVTEAAPTVATGGDEKIAFEPPQRNHLMRPVMRRKSYTHATKQDKPGTASISGAPPLALFNPTVAPTPRSSRIPIDTRVGRCIRTNAATEDRPVQYRPSVVQLTPLTVDGQSSGLHAQTISQQPKQQQQAQQVGRKIERTFTQDGSSQQFNIGPYKTIPPKLEGGITLRIKNSNTMSYPTAKIGQSAVVKQNSIPNTVLVPTGTQFTSINDLSRRISTAPPVPTGVKLFRSIAPKPNVVVPGVATNSSSMQTLMATPAQQPMAATTVAITSSVPPLGGSLIMQPVVVSNAAGGTIQQQPPTLIATNTTGSAQLHNLVLPVGTTIKMTPTGLVEQPLQPAVPAVPVPVSVPVPMKPPLHSTVVSSLSPMTTSSVSIPLTQQPQSQRPANSTMNKVLLNAKPSSTPVRTVVTTNIPPLYVPPNKASNSVGLKPMMATPTGGVVGTHRFALDSSRMSVAGQMQHISQRRMSVGIIRPLSGLEQPTRHDPTLQPMPKLTPFTTPRAIPMPTGQMAATPRYVPVPTNAQPNPPYPATNIIQPNAYRTAIPTNIGPASSTENDDPDQSSDARSLITDTPEHLETFVHEKQSAPEDANRGASIVPSPESLPMPKMNYILGGPYQEEGKTKFTVKVVEQSVQSTENNSTVVTNEPVEAAVVPIHRNTSPVRAAMADPIQENTTNVSPRLQKRSISEAAHSREAGIGHTAVAMRRRFSELSRLPEGPPSSSSSQTTGTSAADNHFLITRNSITRKLSISRVEPMDGIQEDSSESSTASPALLPVPPPPTQQVSLLCNEKMDLIKQEKSERNKLPLIEIGPSSVTDEQKSGLGLDRVLCLSQDVQGEDTNRSTTSTSSSESNPAIVSGKAARSGRKQKTSSSRGGKKNDTSGGRLPAAVQTTAPASESSLSTQDENGAPADTSTVADYLHWYDGVGFLAESLLHFEFNKFGMVQPITAEEYDRHCNTDVYAKMQIPLEKRPASTALESEDGSGPSVMKRSRPNEALYRCIGCRGQGHAVDFVTPDYCSMHCIQTSTNYGLRRYMKNSTHILQQNTSLLAGMKGTSSSTEKQPKDGGKDETEPKPGGKRSKKNRKTDTAVTAATTTTVATTTTTTTTTSDDDSMSSLSLNSSAFLKRQEFRTFLPPSLDVDNRALPQGGSNADGPEDTEFNWNRYLKENGAEAAPARLFGPRPFPLLHGSGFSVGMKLEAIDPENNSLFCVCTVAEVRGHRLKLHFDGYPSEYDFWLNVDSCDIFPPGWCSMTNRTLQPPGGFRNRTFSWEPYLKETGATVPHHRFFAHLNKTYDKNRFEIGMALEADDLKKSGKVCVATVADKLGDRILVHFDGWDDRYDYWVNVHSNYIHPVNWHQDNNDKITAPPEWNKPFEWPKYLRVKSRYQVRSIIASGKQLFKVRPPIGFKPGQRLEVVDRKQKKLVRPATVVATDGYEVRLCFDGWPRSYSFWIEDDSPDLHPINWCARTKHPLEPPPNSLIETATYDGTCEIKFCLGRGNAKYPNKKFHDRPTECPYKRSNWMGEDRKPLRISHDQILKKHVEQQPDGEDGENEPEHKPIIETIDVKQLVTNPSLASKNESATSLRRPSMIPATVVTAASTVSGSTTKRIKREMEQPSSAATPTPPPSVRNPPKERIVRLKQEKELIAPAPGTNSTTVGNNSTALVTQESIRVALPVIDAYGPRLMHSYEVWRKHSRYLDEYVGTAVRKNPLHWTTDETARYIERLPGCAECAERIRHEEITGKSFLSFTQDDLRNHLGIKVGPAIKIYNRIIRLRQLVTAKFIQL